MIKIDLNMAVAAFVTLPLVLVFARIIFYNYRDASEGGNTLQQCPFCAVLFYAVSPRNGILTCPRCKSFVQSEESGK